MAEHTVTYFNRPKRAGRRPKNVTRQKFLTEDGQWKKVWVWHQNSPTLDEDILFVVTQNVRAARRENKKLLGSRSGAPRRKRFFQF